MAEGLGATVMPAAERISTFSCALSPKAEMIYLAYQVVLAAADAGFDIVGAFHGAHRRIDAYTLKTSDAPAQALAERLLGLGVDQITTDDPEGLAALLGATNG